MTSARSAGLLFYSCCLLLFSGCLGGHSPASRFYTLTTRESGTSVTPRATDKLLAVGPVIIPDYLDRPQIVTRSGVNALAIAEFDRWGGSLGSDISRVLTAELSARLGPSGFTVLPWQTISLSAFSQVYRVQIDIVRFDGTLGKEVVLNALWQLLRKEGVDEQPLISKEIAIVEPVAGGSYEELVAAMGRALRKFSASQVDSIGALPATAVN